MRKALLIACLFCSLFSFAQKERNIWCFGTHCGLDFNSGSPVAFSGPLINTTEGCSSIADSSGNLLFYTDGLTIWNRNHSVMPNGTGLFGGGSSTQSGLIVQKPGSSSIYYVFTPAEAQGANGLCYSIVDMTLQSGLGDVTTKNIQLFTPSTEKITGTHHSNGKDVWVVGHPLGNDNFYSYLLTSAGLSAPVITSVGDVHSTSNGAEIGYMKISPDGTHLALAIRYQFNYQLFNFNPSTGVVSNPISIPATNGTRCYGVEFSPNNTKLYLSEDAGLSQYDITSNNSITINASKVLISSDTWAIQLAPDKKIYCANYGGSYLNVINNPNLSGTACNWQANAVYLQSGTCQLGLPTCIFDSVPVITAQPPLAHLTSSDSIFCDEGGRCIDFFDQSVNNPTAWKWSFPGGSPDTSTLQNPTGICYYNPGTYAVTLIVNNNIGSDTLTVSPKITFGSGATAPVLTIRNDTIFCSHESGYQWYYNGTLIPGATDSFYVATSDGSYNVYITDNIGCSRLGNGLIFTSTSELNSKNEIKIYPNPVKDQFVIQASGFTGESASLEIFNTLGEKVYSDVFSGKTKTIDCKLAPGIYFICVNNEHSRFTWKMLKN